MAVEPEKNEDWLGSEVGEVSSISQPPELQGLTASSSASIQTI